jgi:hypothetical protein
MSGERSTFILKGEKFEGMLTTRGGVDGTGIGSGTVRLFKTVEQGQEEGIMGNAIPVGKDPVNDWDRKLQIQLDGEWIPVKVLSFDEWNDERRGIHH